jgi:lipopolysaccharide/colanic/teichoic acid biosynthesis glycosyltransferase
MKTMYKVFFKRIFDLTLATLGLLLLSPIFITIYIILYFTNDGAPFFIQPRPGKDGNIFKIIKFKTMNDKIDSNGVLLPDIKRITKIGDFIRKTSLDEIPQLINVIKGDMSIIGPRPLLVAYLPLYNEKQSKRHNVKPGITGWAQVNGRNAISWEQKFAYDIWYVDNINISTDFKILLKTISKVFRSEGISSSKEDTMQMFEGSSKSQD